MFTFLENLVLFLVNEWAPVRQIILTENWKAPCFFSYHSSVLGKTENGFHSGLVWRRAVEKPGSRLTAEEPGPTSSDLANLWKLPETEVLKLLYVYMTGSKPVRRRPTPEHLHFLNGKFSSVGTKSWSNASQWSVLTSIRRFRRAWLDQWPRGGVRVTPSGSINGKRPSSHQSLLKGI